MKIVLKGNPKEIAALVLGVQERTFKDEIAKEIEIKAKEIMTQIDFGSEGYPTSTEQESKLKRDVMQILLNQMIPLQ